MDRAESRWNEPFSDVETWLVSYPKAGRTWLRYAIAQVLHHEFGEKESLELQSTTRRIRKRQDKRQRRPIARLRSLIRPVPRVPIIACTHDAASIHACGEVEGIEASCDYRDLVVGEAKYASKNVLFVIRDPRDVVVSCYFDTTRRGAIPFEGTLSDYLRDPRFGILKVVAFYEAWSALRHVPKRLLVVRYEEMQRDFAAALRGILDFMDGRRIGDAAVERAIRESSFERMYEVQFTHRSGRLAPADVDDPESYKVRRGVVGGYRDYLSPLDIEYANEAISECAWYSASE